MDRDTIIIILEAAILAVALIIAFFAYRRRRLRAKGVRISNLLNEYFQDGMTADELGARMQKIANRHSWGAPAFYGLTVAAFQSAIDATRARQTHSEEDERKLISMLAAAKRQFGLTDRYQIEGWRAGRE